MEVREWRQSRKFVSACALLSVLYYAALLPGHLTSQFAAQILQAELSFFGGALCKGGGGETRGPAAPGADCPICKSLSALALGIFPTPQFKILAPAGGSVISELASNAAVEAARIPPRSRGPPLPA